MPPLVTTCLLPELLRDEQLQGACAVVVDILRATTCICRAIDAGALSVRPYLTVEEAKRAAELASTRPLLAGERGGLPIDGFDLGNSPAEFAAQVAGRDVLMTTTNGTRAIVACAPAQRVLIGCFNNISAIARAMRQAEKAVIVCAGTNRAVTLEDTLFAGALLEKLGGSEAEMTDDSSAMALSLWRQDSGRSLAERLQRTQGGRNLRRIHRVADIEEAAGEDNIDCVPEFDVGRGCIVDSLPPPPAL